MGGSDFDSGRAARLESLKFGATYTSANIIELWLDAVFCSKMPVDYDRGRGVMAQALEELRDGTPNIIHSEK